MQEARAHILWFTILAPLAVACGDDTSSPGDGSGSADASSAGSESGSEDPSTGQATSVGSASGSAGSTATSEADTSSTDTTAGGTELTHGFVTFELRRAESQTGDPFGGTTRVEITMQYEACLQTFYQLHPELAQDGVEGAAVFGGGGLGGEGWRDRLCMPLVDAQVDCEVFGIEQSLAGTPQLTVTYAVTGVPEGGRLAFGPLPTSALAACEAGLLPVARVGSNDAVRGSDGVGTQLWLGESYTPPFAATDQGAPIQVGAARVE